MATPFTLSQRKNRSYESSVPLSVVSRSAHTRPPGMALSPNGEERTASTGYHLTHGGERYTDFSTHGHLSNGYRDTGDALQLAMKVWNRSKSSILTETAREITRQARTEMEAAARADRVPPVWVRELMTPAGWRRYDALRVSTFQVETAPAGAVAADTAQSGHPVGVVAAPSVGPEKSIAEELQKTDDGDDFIERYQLQRGALCAKCSCELQRSFAGRLECCRCFPVNVGMK